MCLMTAAFVGIDWGDKKHDVCLRAAESEKLELSILEHTPEALSAWANELRERFAGRRIAVCLETQRGPIVSALLEHDIFVLFPVNPQSSRRRRPCRRRPNVEAKTVSVCGLQQALVERNRA